MGRSLISLAQLLETDLEAVCRDLREELGALAGRRLLITGGGGFLGYYLVQAALHWNRTRGGAAIDVTVYDNYLRGVPAWLEALRADPHLTPLAPGHDPAPAPGHGPFRLRDPRRRHRLADVLPRAAREDASTRTSTACAICSTTPSPSATPGGPLAGFLFYSSSEIYGDPAASAIPTPETYRGNVSCTGPRACYDESKRFGETLCVTFAQHEGLPVRIARPFNNYGPGLKITDGRVLPDFARDVLAGRDIVMFSDGSPTRTFCYATDAITGYYKVLVRGRDGESYNVGIDRPEISMARARRARDRERAASCSATAARWCSGRPPRPTTWSTTRTGAAR